MKKKIANIIELLFLAASFIMLNTASIRVVVGQGTPGSMSILSVAKDFVFATIPTYVFYGLCAAMCLVSVFTSEKYRDGKVHSFLPILLFLSANYLLLSAGSNNDITVLDASGFPTKAFEACLLVVMIIGFAKRSPLIAGVKEHRSERKPASQADELKKYKELLDSGAITQEEYDAKKKQLLGL